MAAAIAAALDHPSDPARLRARAAMFDFETTVARYDALLRGRACPITGTNRQPEGTGRSSTGSSNGRLAVS
jgi:hypothetical protein